MSDGGEVEQSKLSVFVVDSPSKTSRRETFLSLLLLVFAAATSCASIALVFLFLSPLSRDRG
jgi:hypothetical protein